RLVSARGFLQVEVDSRRFAPLAGMDGADDRPGGAELGCAKLHWWVSARKHPSQRVEINDVNGVSGDFHAAAPRLGTIERRLGFALVPALFEIVAGNAPLSVVPE